jgi:rubrerythrin
VSDEGGDAVCWLHLTCPACGLLVEQQPRPERCPRCAEPLPAD